MDWMLWGVDLSPFALKVEALLRFAGLPFRWLPASGGFREALRHQLRRQRVVSGRLPLTWPVKDDLDEFPRVPFLFGERFSVADASVYGQLGMNRSDPRAWAWIRRDAPATAAWIERLAVGDFSGHHARAPLVCDAATAPLLDWVARTFVPLMRQNQAAFDARPSGCES